MSSQARKSLGAARRGPQKAHIPFRADNLGQGKKTGIMVGVVPHGSDEFEPFDEVINQADELTPPHRRGKSKVKRITSPLGDFDDDNGEVSMELDETNPDSPAQYFRNAVRPSVASNANRSATSSRHENRSSADYDRIPSPRASPSSSQSRIARHAATTPSSRARSNLSKTVHTADDYDDDGGLPDLGNDDDLPPMQYDDDSPRQHQSFTEMAAGGDSSETEDAENVLSPVSKGKERQREKPSSTTGRSKSSRHDEEERDEELPAEEDGLEEEIEAGLNEVEEDNQEEPRDSPAPPPQPQKPKRGRPKKEPQKKRKKGQENVMETFEEIDGARRSKRTRMAPLEWWRGERIVFGRRESGVSMVPVMKGVITVPKEEPRPLGAKKGRRGAPRSKSNRKGSEGLEIENEPVIYNPEEGWDDETDAYGVVLDYLSQQPVNRRIAFTSKMLTPKAAKDNLFYFQKIFGDGDFIAAGQLVIPPGGMKPSKGTKDNTYIFYLIEGAVTFKVHQSSFLLATGAMFLIPRGNNYYIENISEREAKLFFAQARKVPPEADAPPNSSPQRPSGGSLAGTAAARSTSVSSPVRPSSQNSNAARAVSSTA